MLSYYSLFCDCGSNLPAPVPKSFFSKACEAANSVFCSRRCSEHRLTEGEQCRRNSVCCQDNPGTQFSYRNRLADHSVLCDLLKVLSCAHRTLDCGFQAWIQAYVHFSCVPISRSNVGPIFRIKYLNIQRFQNSI